MAFSGNLSGEPSPAPFANTSVLRRLTWPPTAYQDEEAMGSTENPCLRRQRTRSRLASSLDRSRPIRALSRVRRAWFERRHALPGFAFAAASLLVQRCSVSRARCDSQRPL